MVVVVMGKKEGKEQGRNKERREREGTQIILSYEGRERQRVNKA